MRTYQPSRSDEAAKSKRIRFIIILCGSLAILAVALATIWIAWSARNEELARADAAMARVQAAASFHTPAVPDRGEFPGEPSQEPSPEPEPSPEAPVERELYTDDPLYRELDWEALHAVNPDIGFWLYIPGTAIDYPVMVEDYSMDGSEYFYLRHDVYGERVSSGSLFTVSAPGGAPDAHMTIFGHNMGGGREIMFGTLSRYKDADFRVENPYAYFYYPDRTERWVVWSAGNVKGDDLVYSMPFEYGSQDYADLITHMGGASLYDSGVPAPGNMEATVTLSTCDRGYGGNSGRFTVHLAPDAARHLE